MIVVAGADSTFVRLIVRQLLIRTTADQIAVVATDSDDLADLAESGVCVRPNEVEVFKPYERVLFDPVSGWDGGGGPFEKMLWDRLSAAKDAGVLSVVHIGIISAPTTYLKGHLSLEGEIKRSGIPFTILRKNVHSEALLPAARLALASGKLICSFSQRMLAPAAARDYAEAAATVLLDGEHTGTTYNLSGPIGLNALGIASVLSVLSHREIEVEEVAQGDLVARLLAAGASQETADYLERFCSNVRYGEWHTAAQDLETLLGHHRISLQSALHQSLSE